MSSRKEYNLKNGYTIICTTKELSPSEGKRYSIEVVASCLPWEELLEGHYDIDSPEKANNLFSSLVKKYKS